MYLRSRTKEPEAPPAPPSTLASATPVFEAPPPPPPPAVPTAVDSAADVKSAKRSGSAAAGCAGPCEGTEAPGFQGQLASKAALARRCYERALRQNSTLQGRMRVAVRVGPNGAVCSANVTQNDLGDMGVASCVAQIFRGATFAPPSGGCVEAQVPIMFSPKN
jgi:hypothetical protein